MYVKEKFSPDLEHCIKCNAIRDFTKNRDLDVIRFAQDFTKTTYAYDKTRALEKHLPILLEGCDAGSAESEIQSFLDNLIKYNGHDKGEFQWLLFQYKQYAVQNFSCPLEIDPDSYDSHYSSKIGTFDFVSE